MTRSPLPPENRKPEEGNRFRHTSRADRPSAIGLFWRRHKGKLKPLFVLGFLGACGWFFLSRHEAQSVLKPLLTTMQEKLPLKITTIRIEGENLTSLDAIHEALGISVGDPMLGFDVKAARDRLNALPFVEDASVERRFSGVIIVRLTERPPFAVWQHKGQFILIDREGNPVPDKGITSKDAKAFMQLPLVVGEGAEHGAAELLDAMAKTPDVEAHMTAATLVGGRRWTLTLKDGASVYLPEAAEPQALTRLEELQKRFGLLDRPVEIIDLRLPDRLTIREKPAPAAPPTTDAPAPSEATPSPASHETKGAQKAEPMKKSGGTAEGHDHAAMPHGDAPVSSPRAPSQKHENEHADNNEGVLPS
ncbi:cell division protein FtsQ/DivIB [Acetobacter conturbans]|uniref:Cell division protein FtsQ n=1 Tax=Acetobacter conturbans TaxID=1737472 RepID=A0ABX0K5Z5_9PROT|nr:cell division protein FtsQ/DivIB [Acetobacter conturbans]NHN89377.1 FtsQ-type POTRA domain-containing protein [Acetobacter conturbans]